MKTTKEPKLLPKPRKTRTVRCVLTLTEQPGNTVQEYTCRPIPSDWHARAYQLRKAGTPTVYHLTQDPDGTLECDCGAFQLGKRRCKHIGSLIALGLLDDPTKRRPTT